MPSPFGEQDFLYAAFGKVKVARGNIISIL